MSELGERMEFYKEKLMKYRTLYFQVTGQDPNANAAIMPMSSNNEIARESKIATIPANKPNAQERHTSGKIVRFHFIHWN